MQNEDYRPSWIEFNVTENEMPLILGEFETLDKVHEFIRENKAVAINHGISVLRHMDNYEKTQVREHYREVLEDTLPKLERDQAKLQSELNEAKKKEKEASDMVNAAISEAKILAKEAKVGLKDINLDEIATFRIPVDGRYYFYTYIDKALKLCAVREIPESEKAEIWNASVDNSNLFKNGEIKAQEG